MQFEQKKNNSLKDTGSVSSKMMKTVCNDVYNSFLAGDTADRQSNYKLEPIITELQHKYHRVLNSNIWYKIWLEGTNNNTGNHF